MLMDKLLRKENLDLKLTPYKVLATGSDHGIVDLFIHLNIFNLGYPFFSFLEKAWYSLYPPFPLQLFLLNTETILLDTFVRTTLVIFQIINYLPMSWTLI